MPSVVNRRWRLITSAYSRLRLRSWLCSGAAGCLIARRSVAFLLLWTRRLWRHCAACSCRTRWPVLDPPRASEDCGIGKDTDGWSSIWMAPDKPHDSVLCLKVLICPLPSFVCDRSVHLATQGASVEKWSVPARHSCRLILISGWGRLGMRAMQTTEGS